MSGAPVREMERRKLNIVEALLLAAIVALVASVIALMLQMAGMQASFGYAERELKGLREQFSAVPAMEQRMNSALSNFEQRLTKSEVRIDSLQESQRELRATKGLK